MQDETDNFKEVFKYYKSKNPMPSLNEVIFFQNNQDDHRVQYSVETNVQNDSRCALLGLTDLPTWRVCSFRDHPGLLYISNPFTALGQRYWITQCLQDYPKKPNKTNIDLEIHLDDWWSYCNSNIQGNKLYLQKLRWTTLGFHHDWNSKVYSDDNRNPFPEELGELCDVIASHLGYKSFNSQAAIVNYYHMGSTLAAHTDHSEVNLEAPLISISFGQSAIFLIGGTDKKQAPSAILLNSGDVVVMSKEARLCYHAVPKILPAPTKPWELINGSEVIKDTLPLLSLKYMANPDVLIKSMNLCNNKEYWDIFDNYASSSRINMNVRQVLHENQMCIFS